MVSRLYAAAECEHVYRGGPEHGSMGFSPPEELPAVASRAYASSFTSWISTSPQHTTTSFLSISSPRSYDKLIGTILFYMVNPRRSDRIILLDFKLRYNDRWMSML